MLKIERIVCPVDFSEYAARAYEYAYSLARHYEAKLYLEHVIPVLAATYPYYNFPEVAAASLYMDLSQSAQQRLREMTGRYAGRGVQTETVVHKGFVPDSILAFARENHADLIVMGTHGRRGLDRLVMGSVTESVLRRSPCPVLAVRKPEHSFVDPQLPEEPVHVQRILFCADFSASSLHALPYALSFAQEYQAELTLLHVLEDLPQEDSENKKEEMRKELLAPIPPETLAWCTVKPMLRAGKAYVQIIQAAAEQQTDLVVMGVRGGGVADLSVFGSTAHRVIQLGPCPVLAVHT
ncbi:MAG TPA: universal stress protein [Terriglobia bacterium]|nr:universal stress protein [Terriglobia bacterium]